MIVSALKRPPGIKVGLTVPGISEGVSRQIGHSVEQHQANTPAPHTPSQKTNDREVFAHTGETAPDIAAKPESCDPPKVPRRSFAAPQAPQSSCLFFSSLFHPIRVKHLFPSDEMLRVAVAWAAALMTIMNP